MIVKSSYTIKWLDTDECDIMLTLTYETGFKFFGIGSVQRTINTTKYRGSCTCWAKRNTGESATPNVRKILKAIWKKEKWDREDSK